jgi:hypothetical protein
MESLPCVIVVDYQRLTIRLGCGKRAFGTGVMTKKDFHEGLAWIDKVLEDDRSVHKKQRHMAHRIFERLRAEEGFSGGYAIVREYVARATLRAGEMFVPLSHRPGHAQADFGQADAYFPGKKVRFHYFAWTCRTRTAASSRPIRPRPLKLLRGPCGGVRFFRRRAAVNLVR